MLKVIWLWDEQTLYLSIEEHVAVIRYLPTRR